MNNMRAIDKHNVRTTPGQKNPERDTWPQHLELINYQLDSTGDRKHLRSTNGGSARTAELDNLARPHIEKCNKSQIKIKK